MFVTDTYAGFKNFEDFADIDLFFNLNKYLIYSPIPLDFRTK